MADKGADNQAEETSSTGKSSEKRSFKVMLGVALILALEAGTIFATALLTNKPEVSAGEPFMKDPRADEERIVELPVLTQRFPNRKSGTIILYETQIAVQVKKKNQERVQQILEENEARIKTAIGTIWRNAEPRHFNEPYLSTLTRQAQETLAEIIDADLPEGEESRVVGVLIPVLVGWRADM